MSAGKMTFRWVSGIAQKQASWFVGSLQGKPAYGAWVVFLVQGFRDNGFLLQFEQTSDPWARARLVGEKNPPATRSLRKANARRKGGTRKNRRGRTSRRDRVTLRGQETSHGTRIDRGPACPTV